MDSDRDEYLLKLTASADQVALALADTRGELGELSEAVRRVVDKLVESGMDRTHVRCVLAGVVVELVDIVIGDA